MKKMEKSTTPLVDEHLQNLVGMRETSTDDFFYIRLKARMEKKLQQQGWSFPLKPVWVIGVLALLLTVNGFLLRQQDRSKKITTAASSSLQRFAESYDQTISSSY